MPRPLRVLLAPLASGAANACRGARVELVQLGQGSSGAAVGAPVPASLHFGLRVLKNANEPAQATELELGTVSGTAVLRAGKGGPSFTATAVPPHPTKPSKPHELLRAPCIELHLNRAQFGGPALTADGIVYLEVPESAAGARFGEVAVRLEIAGAVEAGPDVNDVLDVNLGDRTIEVELVDEVGEALAGVDVSCAFTSETVVLRTDTKGLLRVRNPLGGDACKLKLADPDAAQKLLVQRWKTARKKALLRAGPYLQVLARQEEIIVTRGKSRVSVQPRVVRSRVFGSVFDTSKAFPLPSARAELQSIAESYADHPGATLLVVGHADTAGAVGYNEKLSLERAEIVVAYFKGDVDTWLSRYQSSTPAEKRWGLTEDQLMLSALEDGPQLLASGDPVGRFRAARGISEQGATGPDTRRALVLEYMQRDRAVLPSDATLVAHGCGEAFPLVETEDGVDEPRNRRVEVFFFDGSAGVLPPPAGKTSNKDSTDYPEWELRAERTRDFDLTTGETRVILVKLLDDERKPMGGVSWTLHHAFGAESGTSNDDGTVMARVPRKVERATLAYTGGALDLTLDDLPSHRDIPGVQRRLVNLGYACSTLGELDQETREALRQFQSDQGLETDGEPNDPTVRRLREVYGH